MRSKALSLILALALTAGLAGAATAQTAKSPSKRATAAQLPPPPPPPDPANQMKTSDQLKRESVQGAATAPLRDLNVVRSKIPDVLLQALDDPYARPPRSFKCPALSALIRPLDEALGPDIDRLAVGDENLMDRGKSTALGAAADLASDAIPFRGFVRKLSGAEAHDRLVQSAIIAGNVRRGYLKGLGESKGCPPPATPSHERAVVRQATTTPQPPQRPPSKSGLTPKYPVR
ncbi:MAG: hypothetical protein KKE02_05750 [Alphaproteobacteria bacterium]|nr:hypothetical protein [Alphaproteobacteria bacterium]MBU1516449.1 hypothetical protein [Alphaproteobacteria bacterium]MBU2094206.1 hypothetical protein [Alphaproteobacteria bacterium]MBU2150504.1 hypothetical protein [Alphaproteobacteria bacterium]MBU2307376.1 hypothetical protein [Alphaproteobacteria bacterium]